MRIARVDATWVRMPIAEARQHRSDFGEVRTFDAAIVRIETEDGLVGWGEGKNAAGSAGTYAGLVHLVNAELAPRLIGRDPREPSVLWDWLYSGTRHHHALARGHALPEIARRGLSIAALSAVDIACWDLLGKALGEPVWRLFGGRKAERLPAYASGGWADEAGIGTQLAGYVAAGGFGAVKMRVGAMDGPAHVSARRVQAARRHLGPGIDIMVDAHGTFTVAEARRFARLVRDEDLAWFEEPVTGDDKAGMAELRATCAIPIAAGESEQTRFDFRDLVTARAVDILQPDLAICGGLTEARRIDALAGAFNLRLAPHLWAGAPAFFAGLHLAAASPSCHILEYSLGANPMLHDLIEEEIAVTDGMLAIPDRPGLGMTIREDVVRRFAVESR
ncbi:mandelate racemase/muconate lactonizing enzyme family protein [Labrys wisconsinensis]|uniref:L-alanine-DL-glutamate epimerase-like enolase superfamily enzyme n=1 Tax=Labrys wisconsinensis TaxID=425677 RepID=A0ABU0JLW7_9HYPH|nr:mandelate racemase/muconate lactonizing enzyme family protein [Labrys wisconsinensis]MDQ0475279.1 L-alanine-DL-glutamate epimerase-like enolase superfamily enzyme [Labrys wisconsinensis]